MDQAQLTEGLRYLASGGAAVVVAIALSFLARKSAKFAALDADLKRALMVGGSAGTGLSAWAVLKFTPPQVLAALQEPFAVIVICVAAALANQAYHALGKVLDSSPRDGSG